MKTTMLIVEFLIGGILVLLALMFLAVSFFPDEVQQVFNNIDLSQPLPVSTLLLLSTIFVAIAYTVGIFSEFFAREMFEWLLVRVRKKQVEKYLDDLHKNKVKIEKNPILSKLKDDFSEENNKDQVQLPTGLMRSYVLMKSPELYHNIASQLHRFRLMRILFLTELIFIVAIFRQSLRAISPSLMWALVFLIVAAILTVVVIHSRFKRYCRDIERSYMVLVLDQDP